MSDSVTINPGTAADLQAIKPLLLELLDPLEKKEGFSVEQSAENFRSLVRDPAHYVLLAKDGDNVLGFIDFTTRRTIMHPRPSGL